MQEIEVGLLLAESSLPFVRHHLDPAPVQQAWSHGGARVVDGTVSRWVDTPPGPVRTCLGPIDDLARLCADLDALHGPPWRVTVERSSYDALPATWRPPHPHQSHWMSTRRDPDPGTSGSAGAIRVSEVPDDVVTAVLDRANPDSFARPGTGDPVGAVGALVRQVDGTGHLRGISTLPAQRGRGLGRALSAELTRRALTGASGLATLGVYVDNEPALAIYRGLGYEPVHTFSSGVCEPGR